MPTNKYSMGDILYFDVRSPFGDKETELPNEFCLFKFGKNNAYHIGEGRKEIDFTQIDAERLVYAFECAAVDLVIDYCHGTLDGTADADTNKAAGWIKSLQIREDGLYAVEVSWTPKATEMLKNREYRYFSPSIEKNEKGQMIKMLPAALTNIPALEGINALMNSIITKDKPMSESDKTVETLAVNDASAELKAMKATIARLEKDKLELEVNSLLDKAISEGKLAPAKRAELFAQVEIMGIGGLKCVLSNLTPVLRQASVQSGKIDVAKTESNKPNPVDIMAARAINVPYAKFMERKAKLQEEFASGSTVSVEGAVMTAFDIDNTEAVKLVDTLTATGKAIKSGTRY